jgi:hypothetical protein
MKTRLVIVSALLIAALLLLSIGLPVRASASRTEVTFVEYDCAIGFEQDWMNGQIYHIRNFVHTNVTVSDNSEVNGINTTVADAEINMATGYAVIRGTTSLQPEGIEGSWEGSWTFIANKGVYRGWAVAQGTGELAGKTLFLNLADGVPDPDTLADKCSGIGDPEGISVATGYILDTGSH